MRNSTIYSIGHGSKELEQFVSELKKYDIQILFDVRSNPSSQYNFHFNRPWLEKDLPEYNIKYKFIGDSLGGLPKDTSCFSNGKVDYSKLRQKDFFQKGIKTLIRTNNKGIKVALMCSESKPEECHRSKLIGQELVKHNISMQHITPKGIKSQEEIVEIITEGFGAKDLFGNTDFTSRNTYN